MAKKTFYEGPLYTITNYIYWFSLSNIYFMLLNIFFILFLLAPPVETAQGNPGYFMLLFVVSLPLGPTLTALLAVMGKIVREGDVSVTREYFKALKQSFKQSMLAWFLEITSISVMLIDIYYFSSRSSGTFLIPMFYAFIIIILILGLYVFPIISRFYMKTTDVIKLSFYYAIKKFKITGLNIFAIAASVLLVKTFPSVVIIFFGSIVCFMIMFYEKDILKELEDKVSPETGSNLSDNGSTEEKK